MPPDRRTVPPWRSRALILLAALGLMALTARLGVWQLDRARQKLDLQAAIEQQAGLPPLATAELARTEPEARAQWHRPVRLQGQWLHAHTVFLDNRQMGGRPGFFVLTPLLLATGDAVIVQRGWVPRDALDRTRLPALPQATGPLQLQARVAPWPSRLADLGAESAGVIRQNLDREAHAAAVGVALRPLSLVQLQPEAGADGLLRNWPVPALDVHKHYGYAAQWFTFCAMIAGLYVWFQLIRPRRVARLG